MTQWKNAFSRFRAVLLDNWPIKVTALILAAILWAAVAAEEPSTQLVPVRLEIEPPPGRSIVSSEHPPVQALFTGTARELIKLYGRPPVIRKALPDSISGSEFQVQLSIADLGTIEGAAVKVQQIEPRTVTVQLDDVAQRSVPVIPRVALDPDSGYQLFGSIIVTPRNITIRGPEARISELDSVVTVALELRGVTNPVSQRLAIDTAGLGGLRLSHQEVLVEADVGGFAEKVLMGIPVVIVSSPPGGWVSDPRLVSVTIRGRRIRLPALTRDSVRVRARPQGGARETIVGLEVTTPRDVTAWVTPDSVVVRRVIRD
ncbi:MAG: CdaR family protein [Gemmatimonadota bacterium]|nr:CdaR family protein [Gemmatimonadota bacterium]MDH5548415.1 CdaR family protein [Gemmatimonadota bacterium]